MFANDDLDIDTEVLLVAKNLDHPALRMVGWRRPARNLDVHHQPFEILPLPAMSLLAINTVAIVHCLGYGFGSGCPILSLLLGKGGIQHLLWTIPRRPLHPPRNNNLLRHLLVDRGHIVTG